MEGVVVSIMNNFNYQGQKFNYQEGCSLEGKYRARDTITHRASKYYINKACWSTLSPHL